MRTAFRGAEFFPRVRKTANSLRRGRDFRGFHPTAGRRPLRQTAAPGKKPGQRGPPWVVLSAPTTLRGTHGTFFSWVDRLPDLQRLALVLEALLARLEERRGRDDYPVRVARNGRWHRVSAQVRRVADSGTQPQPCARCAASARSTTRASRRSGSTTTASRGRRLRNLAARFPGATTSPGS